MKQERKPSRLVLALFFFAIPANLLMWGATTTGLAPRILQLPFILLLLGLFVVIVVRLSGFNSQEIPEKTTQWYKA